jgi:hypothetical protein
MASHVHEFHKEGRDQSEHYEVVRDGQQEIEIEHGLVTVCERRVHEKWLSGGRSMDSGA